MGSLYLTLKSFPKPWLALCFLPFISNIIITQIYGINIPRWDEWAGMADVMIDAKEVKFIPAHFWEQHYEHRHIFGHLIIYLGSFFTISPKMLLIIQQLFTLFSCLLLLHFMTTKINIKNKHIELAEKM